MAKDLKFSVLLDYYGNMLTDKQRSMMECYYYDDLSLSEIAVNEGITRQGVRDAIKRSESELESMEEKLGFVRAYGNIELNAEQIVACCESIKDVAEQCGVLEQISEHLEKITEICDKYIENE